MLGIRHNIITLLYAAKGHLENHFYRVKAENFATREDQLASAERSLQRTYDLVRRTLDMTRTIGRRIKPLPKSGLGQRANLRDAWASINKQLPLETQSAGIQMNACLPYTFPELLCDPQDLEEALSLIIQNSIDAFNQTAADFASTTIAWPNKKIVLRAELGVSQNETRGIITIADNGPGMSQNSIGQIFQPFFSTRLDQGGNGLGLYLANQLIAKNNGTIRVSSFEGCGCTFVIELPLAAAIPQPSERVA